MSIPFFPGVDAVLRTAVESGMGGAGSPFPAPQPRTSEPAMSRLTRRHFLRTGAMGAGALAAAPVLDLSAAAPAAAAVKKTAFDRVALGKTGVMVSRLAQGTGVHGGNRQSDHTRMGQEAFTRIMRHGFEQGINFWDMADLYGTHPSCATP